LKVICPFFIQFFLKHKKGIDLKNQRAWFFIPAFGTTKTQKYPQ
jgi:hypothetical protein